MAQAHPADAAARNAHRYRSDSLSELVADNRWPEPQLSVLPAPPPPALLMKSQPPVLLRTPPLPPKQYTGHGTASPSPIATATYTLYKQERLE